MVQIAGNRCYMLRFRYIANNNHNVILRMGSVMNVGSEKIILLYNPSIYSTSDVISSYVYRKGIQSAQYSFSTAVGIFNSIINCVILGAVNAISRKVTETSLW